MKKNRFYTLLMVCCLPLMAMADIDPTATYIKSDGTEVSLWDKIEEDAPLTVRFAANPTNIEAGATIEWHFNHQGAGGASNLTRYEENTEFIFTESGTTTVTVMVMIGGEAVETKSINVSIYDSHLEMPNAFSPNDDNTNDIYGAKGAHNENAQGRYRSIVEFHAWIFNRWGQKLYEWTDIKGGWDGKYNGEPVKEGVYFVLVKAKGADGKEYNIRRDVNLIRNFNTPTNSESTE